MSGASPLSRSNRVVLAINSLAMGGAERQIVNLAIGFKKAGWDAHLYLLWAKPETPHYAQALRDEGLRWTCGDQVKSPLVPEALPVPMPARAQELLAAAHAFMKKAKPDLVIAYLDWSSTITALAAALAGVPRIVVSGRNYPPTHFPHLFPTEMIPVFRDVYRCLVRQPQVHITNNSRAGGAAYARWLGLPKDKVVWVPNALTPSFMRLAPIAQRKAIRARLGLAESDIVILGVFRLTKEKRPMLFLSLIAAAMKTNKRVKALICGEGPERAQMETRIKRLGLSGRIQLVGALEDVRGTMRASDVLLHVALYEGMPNVIMEAQSQELPVLCARSGGVVDCLAPELVPYAFAPQDRAGMAKGLLALLSSKARRERLGTKVRAYVCHAFSVKALVKRNLDICRKE